ncbi:histidyl-tRNA synthetase [Sporodiniella umbellata]|nr:histidyl-tRNA synthetase [Sporodiniella umbellata]
MAVRKNLFQRITKIFERHGAVTIDTPVFELTEILSGKYGEDSKLIYNLADQGGEACSLRYDLTVPFARYLAMQGKKEAQQVKRYHLAKVYRRDQPIMTKGRLREFLQCDFDIAGQYDPMIPDAEVLKILSDTLEAFDVPFYIKLNHRKLLDGLFQVCGVEKDQIRPISSAIDKLDKMPWDQVKREMTEEKGLSEQVADRIGSYVLRQDHAILDVLEQDTVLMSNSDAREGLADIRLLQTYLDIFGVQERIRVDLSLARGLDYYTGIIYEAIQTETEGLGSIAAGGRYDHLVGMFSGTNKKGQPKTIPCVGVSVGIERLFSLLMARQETEKIKSNQTQVYIISVGDGLLKERMQLARELWDAGINASFMFKNKPKLEKQWSTCEKEQIPFAVIIGQNELDTNQVRIKDMRQKTEQGGGEMTERKDMVDILKNKLE